jgi:hypothetical protein
MKSSIQIGSVSIFRVNDAMNSLKTGRPTADGPCRAVSPQPWPVTAYSCLCRPMPDCAVPQPVAIMLPPTRPKPTTTTTTTTTTTKKAKPNHPICSHVWAVPYLTGSPSPSTSTPSNASTLHKQPCSSSTYYSLYSEKITRALLSYHRPLYTCTF